MQRYIAVRLAQGLVVILLVSIGTFVMLHVIPGDPVSLMIGQGPTSQEQIDLIRKKWGLDRPLPEQYVTWIGHMLLGDFGQSVVLRWLPPFGLGSWQGYVLPVAVIVVGQLALLARLMRSATLDNLGEDFVRTARAKGLRESGVVIRH